MKNFKWSPVLVLAGLLAMASGLKAQSNPYIGFVYPAGGQRGTTFQVRLGGQRLDNLQDAIVSSSGVQARLVEYRRQLGNQEFALLNEQLKNLKAGKSVMDPAMVSMMMSDESPVMMTSEKDPVKKPEKEQPKPAATAPVKKEATSPTKTPIETPEIKPDKTAKEKTEHEKTSKEKAEKEKTDKTKSEQEKMIKDKAAKEKESMEKVDKKKIAEKEKNSVKTPEETAAAAKLMSLIQTRISEYCNRPASPSISSIAIIEVTIDPDADPGPREIRLITKSGISNPLVFHVGEVPEVCRAPMKSADFQVLGKEEASLRKRPVEEEEVRITVPCTMNGQIASGEVNRYRFNSRKGQRLVITTYARELIPYIADAVPGWFQPVIILCNADGKEVGFDDDFRFKPDPTLYYEVPKDGEYVLTIQDAIYRGREDFVYRVTIGEIPFVTSIFPLGRRISDTSKVEMTGWNLQETKLSLPPENALPGIHMITAKRKGFISNEIPFDLDTLPESFDKESNNDQAQAQKVSLPIIVNGHIDTPGDMDCFQVEGHTGDTIVAEIHARRLDSPMDSILKITDSTGKVLAFNDDYGDPGTGLNTHHADSYLMFTLPADGTYYVHLGEASHSGGEAYAYRLRISAPQPDFELRIVPSSLSLRSNNSGAVDVYAIRRDGFTGPITLDLKDPPDGFSSSKATLAANQEKIRLNLKTTLKETEAPLNITIEGHAKIYEQDITHDAVPAEDKMQAFLWRHLVPAKDMKLMVYDPSNKTPPLRIAPEPPARNEDPSAAKDGDKKIKFTKQQVASRLRELKRLYEECLLADDFYLEKVKECSDAL